MGGERRGREDGGRRRVGESGRREYFKQKREKKSLQSDNQYGSPSLYLQELRGYRMRASTGNWVCFFVLSLFSNPLCFQGCWQCVGQSGVDRLPFFFSFSVFSFLGLFFSFSFLFLLGQTFSVLLLAPPTHHPPKVFYPQAWWCSTMPCSRRNGSNSL